MIEQLRQRTLHQKLWLVLALAAAAVALFVWTVAGSLPLLLRGPLQESELTADTLEGSYATIDVDVLVDYYAETTSDGSVESEEYLMPVYCADQTVLVGVKISGSKKIAQADAVLNSTVSVLNGSAKALDGSHLQLTGTFCAMDAQTSSYFTESLTQDGLDQENSLVDGTLPLVFEPDTVGAQSTFNLVLYTIVSAALLAWAAVVLIRALTGSYQKEITAWCDAQSSPEGAREALDTFYRTAQPFENVRADAHFLMYDHGADSWVCPLEDVVWLYQTTTQHRTNGIPTGKTFVVTVWTLAGGKARARTIGVRNEAAAREMLQHLAPCLPMALFGYRPEWLGLFRKNPDAFVAQMRAARLQQAQQPEQQTPQPVQGV